jgi:hypothetical protein
MVGALDFRGVLLPESVIIETFRYADLSKTYGISAFYARIEFLGETRERRSLTLSKRLDYASIR